MLDKTCDHFDVTVIAAHPTVSADLRFSQLK